MTKEHQLAEVLQALETEKEFKGEAKVTTVVEDGFTLTEKYGFTIVQENGLPLAFDVLDHPKYGKVLLFANEVLFLGFWPEEKLRKGKEVLVQAFEAELLRRGLDG